jgi:hypothetical protein
MIVLDNNEKLYFSGFSIWLKNNYFLSNTTFLSKKYNYEENKLV